MGLVYDLMCGWVLCLFGYLFVVLVLVLSCYSMFGLRYCGYMDIWLLNVLIVLV